MRNFLPKFKCRKSASKSGEVPDISQDRKTLKLQLQALVGELQDKDILSTGCRDYVFSNEIKFTYESEARMCKMFIRHHDTGTYQLCMQVSDEHWNNKECLICEDTDLRVVVGRLSDKNLADKLYHVIYKWEEGECIEKVIIPKDTQRLAPMLLDSNMRRGKEKSDSHEEYPLYQYRRIGTLVIPGSLDIPHSDGQSPFATYKQRGFVGNHPTEWEKIHIANIENNSPHLIVEEGVLYSADKTRLIYCFEEKSSFVVPSTVTTIEPYAFCLQKRLQHVELHDGITSIGDAAFMACRSLTEISIPKQVKRIWCDTFDGCTSLRKVSLPDGLEVIDIAAFRQCKALGEIRLPDSLRGVRGFEGCSALREIEIPLGVERISGFLFCYGLRKVVLHEGVKSIDDYAFRYCDNLSEINLPDGLEHIGVRAFYPSSLSKLVFPTTVKEIGSEAFYYNKKLYSVKFQSDVAKIGQAAFACCPLLLKARIRKPDEMKIKDDVFKQDTSYDKFCFWD